MGLSPAAAGAPSPGRPAARGAPLFPPGKRGRRGPERENLVGFPPLDFSFPSWGVFYREIHYSVDERKSGRNSGRSDDIKDVIVHELCSRGGCFFVSVTGYVTAISETEFRSTAYGTAKAGGHGCTKVYFGVSFESHSPFSCLPLRGRCQTRSV